MKAIEALIGSLRRSGPLDFRDEALGQVALTLAETLDDGAGMAAAAVAKQLLATIDALTKDRDDGDDDAWIAGLSSAVRDPSKPR